jgi:hypothetical protein
MFRHLTDTTKALGFYSIAFVLATIIALLAPLIGAGAGFVTMFTPLIAVLLMLLVVTRDGYSREGWRSLGLHRAGLRGWPLALLGPALVLGCTYALAWRIGMGSLVLPADPSADMLLNLLVDLVIGCCC